jgi:hypothetical protein
MRSKQKCKSQPLPNMFSRVGIGIGIEIGIEILSTLIPIIQSVIVVVLRFRIWRVA